MFSALQRGWRAMMASDFPTPPARDANDDFWFTPIGARARGTGLPLSVPRARKVPVVSDSLKVLAETTASLSSGMFEHVSEGETRPVPDHPVNILFDNPNPEMTSFEFFYSMVDDLAAEGNFYAEMIDRGRGVDELWRIEPRYVTVEVLPDRTRRFRVREPGRSDRVLLEDQIWHIRRPPLIDNATGASPIAEGWEVISAAIALQEYAAAFFTNDATPPFYIKHPSHFADQQSRRNWLKAFKKAQTGGNRHNPAVLEYGMDLARVGVTNEEAQFLETRKELNADIARVWRMPPHKVGIMEQATFSNIEHQALEFVIDTLRPWLTLVESAIKKSLIINRRRFFFEFNVASLLRGDIKARFEAYALGRQWGWLSVNEVRRLERMNGIGLAGDRYMEPLNMAPVGTSGDGAESEDRRRALATLHETTRIAPRKGGALPDGVVPFPEGGRNAA